MKINNRRELQNIAITHSADIDYKILWRFTKNVQKNHIFFTVDTTLPSSDPLRFRKKLFYS